MDSAMTFPNYPFKHDGAPLLNPEDMLRAYLGRPDLVVPESVVLGYSTRLPAFLHERGFHRVLGYPYPWHAMWLRDGATSGEGVGVVEGFGIGAPVAALVMEELVALGVRRFINIGISGALHAELKFGDLVLCTSALRDEGLSHHYVASQRYAAPSATLTARLAATLVERGVKFSEGPCWTVDAIFRETLEEAVAYRDEGVLCVEMEASALFVVGAVRNVDVASLVTISDHLLADEHWLLAPSREVVDDGLRLVLDAALTTLEN
jgi:uridine phosphorylase